ncbi:MAG: alpha/beta fold hydrolase [Candidatus Sedimenticola sp. (ex Thyasira tokunagai)]
MKLYYREYGTYSDQRPTLILLHGLLGSSSNWHSIARRLEGDFHIIVPDLRNHGRSPHSGDVSYPALAADLSELLENQGFDSALFIGHSMGGKAAMWLALEQPERVAGLVVVDIAPVNYPNRFSLIYDALQQLDLAELSDRNEADGLLSKSMPERGLRQYLLQNLVQESGRWRWRINLEGLQTGMDDIVTFPDQMNGRQYPGDALFIYGSESDYVTSKSGEATQRYFPFSRFRAIPGAGHWVYSEQPDAFVAALIPFLKQTV